MSDPSQPWWLVLLTFAAAPALCEEIAFRGFVLSGFNQKGRRWLAIGLSSLAFGVMHMIPQQVFNASMLGIVLGMIAVRSNSLLPCIVFHLIYNSMAILHGRLGAELGGVSEGWFISVQNGQLRYLWPLLLLAAAIAIPLLRWLAPGIARNSPARPDYAVPAPHPLEGEACQPGCAV
jgi:sodium transport system permease protein